MNSLGHSDDSVWHPEYASYMLESTPKAPYSSTVRDLLTVEDNMRHRRQMVRPFLKENECLLSITSFPILGSIFDDFFVDNRPSEGHRKFFGDVARSLFVPDSIINDHPRFATLTRNIRTRRGRQVSINLPVYRDTATSIDPVSGHFIDPVLNDKARRPLISPEQLEDFKPNHVHMDAMGFGMGCCCLQLTFQACTVNEARKLYDQLAVLSPLTLALTAASPIHRGFLVDTDCRWDVIAASVDDRTPEERGDVAICENSKYRRIFKSRYDSIDTYIFDEATNRPDLNDLPLVIDSTAYTRLTNAGFDEAIARHVAHLFIRDPLVIYRELLEQDNHAQTDHFENIQSTNWNTMRFKPPPPNSSIGWRVEFRAMEVQFCDFENAAFCCFIVLMTRVILSFDLNLYMPLSLVDVNMMNAQKGNAVNQQKFWFKSNRVLTKRPSATSAHDEIDVFKEMTLDEIINGPAHLTTDDESSEVSAFPGLMHLIVSYLDTLHLDLETRCGIMKYLTFVSKKASGEIPTNAAFIRNFVMTCQDYKHDSVISAKVNYLLLKEIEKMSEDQRPAAY